MSSGTDGDVLSVRGLTKWFEATRALDRVEFDVRPGEVHALVGHNGSGKSTLIKILAGFHEPEPGSAVTVCGVPLGFGNAAASMAAGLRFVHQDLGLVRTLNAVENLALGVGFETGRVGRIRWAAERRAARRRMHELGYDIDVERPVGELKAAERTGIAIARALHHAEDARVLVVDEPTAVLPRHEVTVLFEAIRRVCELGLGVIYVSHRLDEVFSIAHRVTVLRDGRRVGTFDANELDEHRLVELMIGGTPPISRAAAPREALVDGLFTVNGLSGTVLSDVSFGAHGGEIVGIAGLTGSGREELLPLLFGARERDQGEVHVAGIALEAARPSAAIAAGMAFVPGDRHRLGSVTSLSVRENLVLTDPGRHAARFGALRRSAERAEGRRWIRSLDIRPPEPDAPFLNLSGGNRQKVVLAKWLRMRPRVLLLLDEPTQGVDVHASAVIHHLAREAASSGAAVVIASSDDEELCECCDRVIVVRDGRIAGELTGDQIIGHALARLQLAPIPAAATTRVELRTASPPR
jgi:ribose transport system ATP-binding protein